MTRSSAGSTSNRASGSSPLPKRMQDPSVFAEPRRLRPDRDPAIYLHFGGGLHPCAGRAVNRFQIPSLVGGLLKRDIGRIGRITWAGGFPHRLEVALGGGEA